MINLFPNESCSLLSHDYDALGTEPEAWVLCKDLEEERRGVEPGDSDDGGENENNDRRLQGRVRTDGGGTTFFTISVLEQIKLTHIKTFFYLQILCARIIVLHMRLKKYVVRKVLFLYIFTNESTNIPHCKKMPCRNKFKKIILHWQIVFK